MPLNSMTGFARGGGEHGTWSWTWELKSVNARGLDVRLRLPPGFDAVEGAARSAIQAALTRGNVNAGLTVQRAGGGAGYRINTDHLDVVLAAMDKLRERLPDAAPPSLDGIMGLRGVIEPEEESVDEAAREALNAAIVASLMPVLKALGASRAQEGERLATALGLLLDGIESLRGDAMATAETQPDAIRARLKEQVDLLLSETPALPADRLAQEAAVLMTKADIREEIDRLGAHVVAVRELLADGGAVGRRLDFLCQELNRESNTICSKSASTALTRIGLDLKAVIEQFREQVQNIE